MKPAAFRKLIATQHARLSEITLLSSRIREKSRDVLNGMIVQSRINAINQIWSEARKTHSEIVADDAAKTDPYMMDGVFTNLQTVFEDTLDCLLTLSVVFERDSVADTSRSVNVTAPNSIARLAKLPKLDLPTFSGRYEDWESFSDLFTSLVHNAPGLDDTAKLQYLKSCLTGAASDLIKDVAITSANYISSLHALKARFYNPRLTVATHLNAFMNLPHVKKESASEIRTLADESQRIVRALTNLKMPVEHWDVWLIHILSARLDPDSRKLWESELSAKDQAIIANPSPDDNESVALQRFPTFTELATFLEKRAHALGMIAAENKPDKKPCLFNKTVPGTRKIFHTSASRSCKGSATKCPLCSAIHALAKCPIFLSKTSYDRRLDVRHMRLCYNCFGRHNCRECTSDGRCMKCRDKHHSLLHFDAKMRPPVAPPPEQNPRDGKGGEGGVTGINVHTLTASVAKRCIILPTAQVIIIGPGGNTTRARALLDQGSEGSFITESTAQLLGLERQRVNIPLSVVGGTAAGTARSKTNFTVCSRLDPNFKIDAEALILPRLTSYLPERKLADVDIRLFQELDLADPQFYFPNSVDLIIGADLYGLLLRPGLHCFPPSRLIAQNTVLGWIVSGAVQSTPSRRAEQSLASPVEILHIVPENDLYRAIERFWILEDVPRSSHLLKPDDEACEKQFVGTHTRSADGRYTIRLPIKGVIPAVGIETRRMALGALSNMHRRFVNNPVLASSYRDFMSTYETLGHMSRIPPAECNNPRSWYLAHHAVVQNSKIRVVFDASRQTYAGYCLNDFLFSGPPLQKDLSLILLNWRRYRFVFTTDIVKMFRQIRVAPEDREIQRILWSPSSNEPPVEFYFNTVTYGTTCAPFLAIRTLMQLARDEKIRFPLGAQCLETNTYVDDTFAGADELSTAIRTRTELTELLKSAGIELDKWAANDSRILPAHVRANGVGSPKVIHRDDAVKTLGIQWSAIDNEFKFSASNLENQSENLTKRTMLSSIARLFDLLGWLSPVTIVAKVIMQDLWLLKRDWDSPLPVEIRERWLDYHNSLSALSTLSISRWLGTGGDRACQIHGFSDASSRAYAAAVYLRIQESDGQYRVRLLAAKTKVAPVKTASIPNLELCGAYLLTKLVRHLQSVEFIHNLPVYMWCDSEIVLKWLSKHPCHWKTFIANPVSHIQTDLPAAQWAHVPTRDNPADVATRGATPSALHDLKIWWHGPVWLSLTEDNWPHQPETATKALHVQAEINEPEILTRFSNLSRLIRVAAYCIRPLINFRRRKNNAIPLPTYLTASELTESRIRLIRLAQGHSYPSEIKLLRAGKNLPKGSSLSKLSPIFSKEEGIVRVGGRLSHAKLPHERKHPPILPRHSNLSHLIINYAHKSALHGGPTLTASIAMQQAWILGRNQLIKSAIRNCIKCQRTKPRLTHQLMGDLPARRVIPARPFTTTGVDYAGPFQIRTTKGRGHRAHKGYIALFVCFTTRAIHMELVSDLTTASFILAYRRFVSRRGVCKNLYSDNSTTFRGADRELQQMFNAASDFHRSVASTIANDGTAWSFIPPTTPHYGGLWEAGVKSAKLHLKKAFGDHLLTFEEFSTALAQIEACLNSRPLCPLTSDVEDLTALTPSHFLIGQTPAFIPDEDPPTVPENRLNRFQLMQRVVSQFWRRWADEYLQTLQERGKWRSPVENFSVGKLVLVRDDRYPPTKWPLGRVVETHPGLDGHVRVVTVRTATTTLRRHIVRLAPLYMQEDDNSAG